MNKKNKNSKFKGNMNQKAFNLTLKREKNKKMLISHCEMSF